MAQRRTKQIISTKEYVDPTTNEKINFSVVQQETTGRRNFYILYMYNLMKLFDVLGGKKYKVVEFIIDNMNSDQQLIMTTQEIEQKSGISRKTISETLKLMEENNLIVRKTGVIMLNPQLFNRRSQTGEQNLLLTFKEIGYEQEQKKQQALDELEDPFKINSKTSTINDSPQTGTTTPDDKSPSKVNSRGPVGDSNSLEG